MDQDNLEKKEYNSQDIISMWDDFHSVNDKAHLSGNTAAHVLKHLNIEEIRPAKVLVVGIGMGYECFYYVSVGAEVWALDISNRALDRVKGSCKILNTREYEKLPKNYFDLIVEFNVINHIGDEDFKEQLKWVVGGLKKDGVFAAMVVKPIEPEYNERWGQSTEMEKCVVGAHARKHEVFVKWLEEFGGKIVWQGECFYEVKSLGLENYCVHIKRV